MSENRLLGTLGLLALAAGAIWLAVWWLRPPPRPSDFTGPPRSGYTIRDFTAWSYAEDGKLAFRLDAPYLQRREGDASLYLNAPNFLLPPQHGAVGEPWRGESQYGWVSEDGSVLKLQGQVQMHRSAQTTAPAADVYTADVTAWPRKNQLATDAPVRMIQGTSTMSGVGMRADLNTKHLELLHDFHGTFKPSPHGQ